METLRERLKEQQGRHQGGSKWIGTAGTSPFGAYGYNPEGVRIGQDESRHRRAVKVWDKREFRNFDDTVELGHAQHQGGAEAAAQLGPRRRGRGAGPRRHDPRHRRARLSRRARPGPSGATRCKVLLFLDVGGSMDPHVKVVEELFCGRAVRVQAPRALLLPQLPLRRRLARQPPPLGRADADLGGAAHLRGRLEVHLRRRRRDEPLRDRHARRRQRALERRGGPGLAERARATSGRTTSGSTRCPSRYWELHPVDRHDRATSSGPSGWCR